MRRTITVLLGALTLLACGSREPAMSPPPAAVGPAPRATAMPSPPVTPRPTAPSPTRFVITNRGATAVEIDTTFGMLASVELTARTTALGPLIADSPDEPGLHLRACACPCGVVCPTCEAPPLRRRRIEPGGTYQVDWNGVVRRRREDDGHACFDAFGPPPDRYRIEVCGESPTPGTPGPCGHADARLPTRDPIEIVIGG